MFFKTNFLFKNIIIFSTIQHAVYFTYLWDKKKLLKSTKQLDDIFKMVTEDSQELQEETSSETSSETLTLNEQVEIIKDWMKNHPNLPEYIGEFFTIIRHDFSNFYFACLQN